MRNRKIGVVLVGSMVAGALTVAHAAGAPGSNDILTLARRAQSILEARCAACHSRNGTAMKHVAVDDYDGLVGPEKPVERGNRDSLLLRLVRSAAMPQAGGPLPKDEIDTLTAWVLAGAPSWPIAGSTTGPGLFTEERVVRSVEDDLQAADARQRPYLRYFTLHNLANNGMRGEELDGHRAALSKLVNSLSWRPAIVRPQVADAERLLYRIDLRNYDWTAETWEKLVRAFPYVQTRPEHARIAGLSGTGLPYLRADWFIANASIPPLYHEILRLPATVTGLERLLGVEVDRNIAQEKFVVRGGVRNSGVSRHNRVLERHETRDGAYWKSFDFRSSTGDSNIFLNPLNFRAAGGEMIFHLPNGMQAYFLVDGEGKRIDRGPTDIVFDRNNPASPEIVNGRSCMSCHTAGMKTFRDDVREVAAQLSDSRTREKALALYPGQETLDGLLEQDTVRYQRAAELAGALAVDGAASEEVGVAARVYESSIRLNAAAADLGMTKAELRQRLERAPKLAGRGLQPLLVENGAVQREIWEDEFRNVVVELGLGAPALLSNQRSPAAGNIARGAFAPNRTLSSPLRSAQDEAFSTARKIVIWSRSRFFTEEALERKIVGSKKLEALGVTVVGSAAKPDLQIRLDRPLFTFDFAYTITDQRTNAVIMNGKVTAINDEAASDEIVRKLEARIAAARAAEPVRAGGFAR